MAPNYYQTKDRILSFLLTSKRWNVTVSFIEENLGIDFDLAYFMCEELIKDGYVSHRDVTTKRSNDLLLNLTSKGKVFITMQGGFSAIDEKEKRAKYLQWSKTIANAGNAALVLLIGIATVYYTDKTDKLENENESLKKELEKIKTTTNSQTKATMKQIPDATLKITPGNIPSPDTIKEPKKSLYITH